MNFWVLLGFICLSSFSVTQAGWCNYDCKSHNPGRLGTFNQDTGIGGLPFSDRQGYAARDFLSVCSSGTSLTDFLIPQPTTGKLGRMRDSDNLIVVCPEDKTINFVNADGVGRNLTIVFSKPIETAADDKIVSFMSTYSRLVVMTEQTVRFYEIFEPKEEAFELKWKIEVSELPGASMSSATFKNMPLIQLKNIVVNLGTDIVFIPLKYDGNPETIQVVSMEAENVLGFNVIDGEANVYFCSSSKVFKVTPTGYFGASYSLPDNSECSGLILSETGKLVFSANLNDGSSYIAELTTASMTQEQLLYTSVGRINALSRVARDDSLLGQISFLGVSTDKGFEVLTDIYPLRDRAQSYSSWETQRPVSLPLTLTSMAQPIVFEKEGVAAYTDTYLIKFFSQDLSFSDDQKSGDFKQFGNMEFFSAPVLAGLVSVVGTSRSGELVLFTTCVRYKLGDDVPDRACPVADLPEASGFPFWMTIVAGAGSVLFLPMCGELLCTKMKIFGNGYESEEEELDYADDEAETETYTGVVPTVQAMKSDIILAPHVQN